ncbi:MAG: glutathione S-transferase [Roseibium sp.]
MTDLPILYSFRRCPYAMRARLAILASGQIVELREVVLRDKAPEFLNASPSATVPCLKEGEQVLDESLDVMIWALEQSDPEGWLSPEGIDRQAMLDLINECDGPFKRHLDRYKYDTRYEGADKLGERAAASEFLWKLDTKLQGSQWLYGGAASIADYAILPFVRQFANSGRDWFDNEDWTALKSWLESFEGSDRFQVIMTKYAKWQSGDKVIFFPQSA